MSLLKSALENAAVAIPFKVRLEPYLVESICELARLMRDKASQNSDVSGLLFGKIEDGMRTVEALKTFREVGTHSDLARRERWEKAYKSTLEESKSDPELSTFEIVGWFSFRIGSGLLSSDVVFHNQHFRKSEDLAAIVWREGPSQITLEVYSKSENEALTSDDYRWGSVRLSADIRHMREPVELAMRVKLNDDSYLRTYDSGEQPSQFDILRRKAEAASERLIGLLYRRKEDKFAEQVRGYIGDGRLPNRPIGTGSEGAAAHSQSYFNPYSDLAIWRGGTDLDGRKAAEPSVPPATAWPASSGAAFATAPARSPEERPELRGTEGQLPATPQPPFSALDYGDIGRAPRTGRILQNEVGGLPMLLRPPAPRKAFPWAWAAVIFMMCFGLAFAFLAMGGLQSDGGRVGQLFQAMFPGGELNLKVRNEDDRLRLSWNQRNHAVASASDATLQIFDGPQHRDIHLDGRQVADGSVLYRPITNDVTFRLEVRGDQSAASGSVRVLDGLASRQEVLDVSAPTSPAAYTAATRPPVGDPALTSDGVPPSVPPSSVPAAGDPDSMGLLPRGRTAAQPSRAPALAPDPITETPYIPGATAQSRAAAAKARAPRYETPQTIGTINQEGGTQINGWDTSSLRKARPGTRPAAVPPPPSEAAPIAVSSTGYVAPRPLMQVMPNTRSIPNGTIQTRTRVEVQVDVDQTGRVSDVHVVSTGVNEQISAAAISAARQWTFEPASNNGQHVNSEHTIVFEFRPEQR